MKGLSLLEVVIALALLAVMSLTIYSGASRTLSQQERATDQAERLQGATMALSRLSRDLKTAYIVKSNDMLGARFEGEITFLGKENRLDFVSFSNLRYIRDAKESDSLELSYFLESDPNNEEAYILMRRQSKLIDSDLQEGGRNYPLLYGVKTLQFEYLPINSEEWVKEWDAFSLKGNNQIPRAIKVVIEMFYPNDEATTEFSIIVKPELTKPLAL